MIPSDVHGAELLACEELNRVLSEAMPGGILHVSAEGRVVLANDEAMRILRLRYDPRSRAYHSELPQQSIHEDGSPCPPEGQPIARALLTGQRQADVTMGLRGEDGGWLWTLSTSVPVRGADGRVIGVVSAFLDITRQRNAELALKQSEARLRSVLESVPGYVLLVDRELTILYCSGFVPGVSASQVLGQSALGFVREAERQDFRERILRIFATGKPESFEVSADAWIGNATYRLSAGVVREGQDVTGVTLIAEDITSQKELEARLMLTERMASIGSLAAGVAHEINNPLTYVLGNLELLERFLKDGNPELGSRIAEAIEGSERISAVVRDLMSFSHLEDNQRMPVDVSSVIDRALRMANHEIQRRALLIRGPSDVPEVGGSAARLGQVLLNLLINAAHAIPKGAREQNQVRISAQSISPDLVRISVSDTGCGIERALLGRIFDPFITTKPIGEGTGLGLYVCHSIVTALGGVIWVDSQVGRGTTFHVDLPVFRCAASHGAQAPSRPALDPTQRLRLLVVDDEPSIAAFIRNALVPHEVATVSSGRDALAALDMRSFDAVLCDVVMPDLTGLQVYEHVRERNPVLARRFLFISGGALGDLAPEVNSSGVPLLYKPFSLRELREALESQLGTPL